MSKGEFLSPFLKRVVDFDFDKFYTPRVRILAHVSMWVVFTLLSFFNSYLPYDFSLPGGFVYALRITLCNIAVFYCFFYLVVPYTLNKNYFVLFILSIPLLIQLWMLLNYYQFKLIYSMGIKIDYGIFDQMLAENFQTPVWDIISPKNVLGHSFEVLSAVSPVFFTKLIFDLSRIYSKSAKANREIQRLDKENLTIENKFLQSQLNPHFLFNTLNNLYGLSLKNDPSTPDFILKLSEIMGYTLYDANVQFIPLRKELEFIKNYFEMEKIRYPDNYFIRKRIINNGSDQLEIAPLLFFVWVENAFKFGLKSNNPFLNLTIKIDNENMYLELENDILSLEPEKCEKSGIGLKNVQRRLDLLYRDKYRLNIVQKQGKHLVELNLDLK